MRARNFVTIAALAAAAIAMSGCAAGGATSASPTPTAVQDVTVQIEGAATPFFAPFYMADIDGTYEKDYVKPKFIYAEAADVIKNVASGNVDFGVVNADAVITAYGKDLPVKVVDTTYPTSIGALLFLGDSGIKGPADLKGKTVAVTSLGSPNYAQLQAMLEKNGLSINDVSVKILDNASIAPALANHEVDAIVFNTLRYYSLKAQGVNVKEVLSQSYLPSFADVIIVSKKLLAADPGLVNRFVESTHKGIATSLADVKTAVDESISTYSPERASQAGQYYEILPTLWGNNPSKYGVSDLKAWQKAIDAQAAYKLIPKSYKAADLVEANN